MKTLWGLFSDIKQMMVDNTDKNYSDYHIVLVSNKSICISNGINLITVCSTKDNSNTLDHELDKAFILSDELSDKIKSETDDTKKEQLKNRLANLETIIKDCTVARFSGTSTLPEQNNLEHKLQQFMIG